MEGRGQRQALTMTYCKTHVAHCSLRILSIAAPKQRHAHGSPAWQPVHCADEDPEAPCCQLQPAQSNANIRVVSIREFTLISWGPASTQPALQLKVGEQNMCSILLTGTPADCKQPQVHSSSALAEPQLSGACRLSCYLLSSLTQALPPQGVLLDAS